MTRCYVDIGGVVKGLLPKYSSDGLENSCHVAFDEEVIHSALQLWDDLASGKHYSSPLDTLIGELVGNEVIIRVKYI